MLWRIQAGDQSAQFDLNNNGIVDSVDYNMLLGSLNTLAGDANLDGIVDVQDFVIWSANKFQANDPSLPGVGWATADFNCDGSTDGRDLLIWNANKSDTTTAVPPRVGNDPERQRDAQPEVLGSGPTIVENPVILDAPTAARYSATNLISQIVREWAHSNDAENIARKRALRRIWSMSY